jgi:hypothetical protein
LFSSLRHKLRLCCGPPREQLMFVCSEKVVHVDVALVHRLVVSEAAARDDVCLPLRT